MRMQSYVEFVLIVLMFALFLCSISIPSFAETPLLVASSSQADTGSPNDIVKWCEVDGEGVRYSSANIDLKGYERCGELQAQKTCDASGQRFISPSAEGKAPHGYLDCAVGPRIYVRRHLDMDSDVIEFQDFREDGTGKHIKNDVPGLKREEPQGIKADYIRSLERLLGGTPAVPDMSSKRRRSSASRRTQSKDLGVPPGFEQYAPFIVPYLEQHGISPDVLKPPTNKREARRQERAVKKLYESLDPESQKLVDQLLGGKDLGRLLK